MIRVGGNRLDPKPIMREYHRNSIQRVVLDILADSNATYNYSSVEQLKLILDLRASVVEAAKDLHRTHFSFKVFRKSKCNPEYWERTDEGGFVLKAGVSPSEAIKDIYINSRQYGTECATAMVIVYLKAVLDVYPQNLFDMMFPNIHLMNWHYLDSDLGMQLYYDEPDYFPGDCRYFKNPDVDPETPHWQGENGIMLGRGLYYGHGIGIGSADRIIHTLNRFRKEGAEESAYLMDSVTKPNFRYLANRYLQSNI